MDPSRLLFISLHLLVFSAFSQSASIEKVKAKNFIGEWYSFDTIDGFKNNQVITFLKNPAPAAKNSAVTYWKFNKSNMKTVTITKQGSDTLFPEWTFIEQSMNIKIVETTKVKTGTFKNNLNEPVDMIMEVRVIKTFHIESISDEKLVVKAVSVK